MVVRGQVNTSSFCLLPQETQTSSSHPDKTHSDFLKAPDNMRCAHCQSILKSKPKVVEKEVCRCFFVSVSSSE